MTQPWHVGDTLRAVATFSELGLPAAPGSVVALVRTPSGAVSTVAHGAFSVVGSSAYAFEQSLSQSGEWQFRFAGLGVNAAADEFTVDVRDSMFD